MKTAFLFPGQGSQAIGMGQALAEAFPAARAVFEEVDAALGQKLSRLMFEGPEAELTLTANAQPALMAHSLAVIRVLEVEKGLDLARDAAFVAGHSLGEYSALCAAGALNLAETARLLRIRGDAMQAAVPVGEGAMAALLGAEWELASEIAREAAQGAVCDVANDNGGGQVVLSGDKAAIDRACAIARERGVKRAIPLPVSAPFHSRLMAPAAERMRAALADAEIRAPQVPVVANVTAGPVSDPEAIRKNLVDQVCGSVRWRESMLWLGASGVTRFIECGTGKVLTGIAKRLVAGSDAVSIGTPEDVAAHGD
ncbi:MAG: ACP S-malonyltransferase [Hyphomicrobiales bacterium]|uniref:ACP S-malonyltransferase n=1 Tax=Rhabdaerophilum calidifontis TaxID=2604328 RepID=UPI00123B82B4|nr:ACP S-malonyltransferase [Rhabdaerophilum calidifontis]MCA1951683.1 ACP S-malonyltransferase [Hyphomicrobiales bacterium]MCA1998534.1 ACP S-malonyltransferase [Hyphomicrobiales bacterium]